MSDCFISILWVYMMNVSQRLPGKDKTVDHNTEMQNNKMDQTDKLPVHKVQHVGFGDLKWW